MSIQHDRRLPHELAEGYRTTFLRLRAMFRARGVPLEEAADLAQETIARTLLHLNRRNGSYDPSEGIQPLLRRIATNLLIDRARVASPHLVPLEGAEMVSAADLDPSEEVARRQQSHQVHRAIDELTGRHRTAMLMSLEGRTPAEIADHLGIRRNAADALLYRARRSLAKNLSAVAGLIRGLAILVALKARSLLRRSGDAAEPVASAGAQMALGVVAATAGLAFVFVTPSSTPAVEPVRPSPAVEAAGASINDVPNPASRPAASSTTSEDRSGPTRIGVAETRVDAREHHVSTRTAIEDPRDGEDKALELDIWHEREEERGTIGPVADAVTDVTCDAVTVCDL